MKFFRRFLLSLIIAILLICLGLWASGNAHLIKAVRSTYLVGKTGPTIDDHSKFYNRTVAVGKAQAWPLSKRYNQYNLQGSLLEETENWETTSLLVVHKDSIRFEHYWNAYSKESLTNSFSMAKSFTSLAIGAAIQDGSIQSLDQKVGDFIPEFSTGDKANISIYDLLSMSSGLDFGESYGDPFGFMAKTYYGKNLYDLSIQKPVKYKPQTVWHYQGGNTLLLSFILKSATGKDLSTYFSEKFWQPMGAEREALWSINEEGGIERSYCCFYSNARDYARVGQLMLDSGLWQGKSLISNDYFLQSIKPVNVEKSDGSLVDYYGLQWWFNSFEGTDYYYARGILGQYIIWVPQWETVIVRLGHKRDPTRGAIVPKDVNTYLQVGKSVIQQ